MTTQSIESLLAGGATEAKQDDALTALASIDGHVDGLETAAASSNTKLDTLHSDLTTIDGHVDGLEAGIGPANDTAANADTGTFSLNALLKRGLARWTSLLTAVGEVQASPTANTLLGRLKDLLTGIVLAAGENMIGKTAGYGFDVVNAPTVTAGAYSANDIMGGLMTFTVARANDEAVLINEIQIAFKSAVTPSLLLVLLEADPTSTTKTDNAAYSLAAGDVFKVRAALPVNSLSGYLTDHGTPNTIRLPNLSIVMKPVSGGKDIYMLMIDLTGVTLGSTSDVQVRVCGLGA